MKLDRSEWDKGRAILNRDAAVLRAEQRLRTAAVAMEKLTGDECWDTFVRMAESMQDVDRSAIATLQGALADTHYLAPEDVARARHLMAVHQARIEARQQLLDLPRQIKAGATL